MTPAELRAARLALGLTTEGFARLVGVDAGGTDALLGGVTA